MQNRNGSLRAFTLIEVMMVVAIIGILSCLAGWQARDIIPRMKTKAAAMDFAKRIDMCRMIAIRTNRECKVEILDFETSTSSLSTSNAGRYSVAIGNSSSGATAWDILPEDSYSDLSDDDQSTGIVDISSAGADYKKDVSILYTNGDIGGPPGWTNSIVFNPRGFLTNPVTDFQGNGYIEVVFSNKRVRADGRNEDFIVMVTRSGMTRLDNDIGRRFEQYTSGTSADASNN